MRFDVAAFDIDESQQQKYGAKSVEKGVCRGQVCDGHILVSVVLSFSIRTYSIISEFSSVYVTCMRYQLTLYFFFLSFPFHFLKDWITIARFENGRSGKRVVDAQGDRGSVE